MARCCQKLQRIKDETKAKVIIYAGDVFHKWNSPPELINFAIDTLPRGYAIPGQHDLPYHNIEDVHKSAYWTLIKADVLKPLPHGIGKLVTDNVIAYGWPWGLPVVPVPDSFKKNDKKIHLAVIHKYIWKNSSTSYPGAPEDEHIKVIGQNLAGYGAAVFGDNHIEFTGRVRHNKGEDTHVINCGGFYNSKSDEKDRVPIVGLLHSDGSISIREMNTTQDKWEEDSVSVLKDSPELEGLIDLLSTTGNEKSFDFAEVLERQLTRNKPNPLVKKLILKWLEK